MLVYNLGLVRQGSHILLLNREAPSWMGCWNGIGGKLEKGEQPRASMIREMAEETGIVEADLHFKGLITWSSPEGAGFGGMYLYVAVVTDAYDYPTPVKTAEGILDWKTSDWIKHPQNVGVASNIPYCLDKALYDDRCYHYHGLYENNKMIGQSSAPIDERIEADEAWRHAYLTDYIEQRRYRAAAERA
ncbi:8-oxo-dGTP diphosphatase [Paenibacillus hodogayensis]|uniref:8-oxo-dGTP diphosphatase n=1 Tax=Paenibacillus hodogayensis TaxID=279208 RepID=A0ABV5W6J2_9BACL